MTQTLLDQAHAAMQAAPDDDHARLRFFDVLAGCELVLMLTHEAVGPEVSPELFDLGDAQFVLAFDREDRLAGFAGRPVPYAALSGRALAGMLSGQGVGVALNLEVAPSQMLLPPEALGWLVDTLAEGPQEISARPQELGAPRGLPESLVVALDQKLASAEGLARKAYLASVVYEDGGRGHVLGITGAILGAEAALASAVNEALVFSGLEAGALDVMFVADKDKITADLARVGLRFDLPQRAVPLGASSQPPGSEPDKPPRLR